MKTLTILKTITAIMTLAILTGLTFVVIRVAELRRESKPFAPKQTTFSLPFPESMTATHPCGDYLCLITVGAESGRRIIIIDPAKGAVTSVITLTETITD